MCFGSKDPSNDPAPKPAQIPLQSSGRANTASAPKSKMSYGNDNYAPPAGPPPSHGAPPSSSSDYAPPAGPPPEKTKNNPFFNDMASNDDDFAPPPGPPPAQAEGSKQPHDWETAVPDTSLLPPPPNYFAGFDRSPTNNATEEEAEAGERWCREFPMYAPLNLATNPDAAAAARNGIINMFAPPFFRGKLTHTEGAGAAGGSWRCKTTDRTTDTCIATYPPLYMVAAHSPLATGRKKTIYYEVNILKDSRREVSLALGFSAPPYPAFRLPGWHRGSVAVHGDDGHKYINDRWGGKTFTKPFHRGETVGLGMDLMPGANGGGIKVEVFFTRDGREDGRWDLHEETDRVEDLPVTGLEGFHDLIATVGVFESVSFEVDFVPQRWKWKGYQG